MTYSAWGEPSISVLQGKKILKFEGLYSGSACVKFLCDNDVEYSIRSRVRSFNDGKIVELMSSSKTIISSPIILAKELKNQESNIVYLITSQSGGIISIKWSGTPFILATEIT